MEGTIRGPAGASADFDTRGLFVVGHARSGTSILMDALNSSSDIYLLGEANLHDSASRANFVEWYNAMHRQLKNPEYKSTYCPLGGSETATGFDTLGWLARRHKYVGEKLAFRSESLGYNFDGFLQFAARHFLRSVYICSLRNPLHILSSCLDMFAEGARNQEAVELYAESCLRSIYLQLRVLFLFNQTYFVIHDRTNEGTFESLSRNLNVNLSDAWLFYDDKFISKPVPTSEDLLKFESVQRLCDVYARLTAEFVEGSLRPRSLWKCRSIMYELHNEFERPELSADRKLSQGARNLGQLDDTPRPKAAMR